jgi:acetyl-CoA C-acetyltransferase
MNDVVITAAMRTAVGKFNGSIAKVPAADLGAQIIKALLARSGIGPDQISEVIMGQVLTAGAGQNPARQASIRAGLPHSVPGMTIGKVCGSGLKASRAPSRPSMVMRPFIAVLVAAMTPLLPPHGSRRAQLGDGRAWEHGWMQPP